MTVGVVVQLGDELRFVPGEVAVRVVRRPVVSDVPGSDLGIALIDGRVVPVLELADHSGDLLVCDVGGQLVALSGIETLGAGDFESADDGIVFDGRLARHFDVDALVEACVPSSSLLPPSPQRYGRPGARSGPFGDPN